VFAWAHLVKPEGCVGLIRTQNAPDRTTRLESVYESAEFKRERGTVQHQDPLIIVGDQRRAVDNRDLDGDEVLQMERAVGAFPAGEVREDPRGFFSSPGGVRPRQHGSAAHDAAGHALTKARSQSIGRRDGRQAVQHCKRFDRRIVQLQREHKANDRSTHGVAA